MRKRTVAVLSASFGVVPSAAPVLVAFETGAFVRLGADPETTTTGGG